MTRDKHTAPNYPVLRAVLGNSFVDRHLVRNNPASFPDHLIASLPETHPDAPDWLVHLAELELTIHELKTGEGELFIPADILKAVINPDLRILDVPWLGLVSFYRAQLDGLTDPPVPVAGRELLLAWRSRDGEPRVRPADDEDLLALKMTGEGLSTDEVSAETGAPVAGLVRMLHQAHEEGLITLPPSGIARPPETHPKPKDDRLHFPEGVFVSPAFVLQWHITQRCDLSCRHCYDRSSRTDVALAEGYDILEQMARFCADRQVVGQVSFSGGNPVLHADFFRFYERAVALGLNVAILGNPCSPEILDRMCGIDKPVFYQVSLEGLEEHNDYIRGAGHFQRTLGFLEMLRERGIFSQVMLTLTAANQDQVVPLGEFLAGKTDSFTFNRLAPVGQGASLDCAPTDGFQEFLRAYLESARAHTHMRLKDNFFNILLGGEGGCFGGCTGSGCGAAFNFLSVICDGTVHACRKMDSPVGNLHESTLADVYDGAAASRYRAGSAACRECELRAGCGGCLAVVKGLGLDPFVDRDPYCPLG